MEADAQPTTKNAEPAAAPAESRRQRLILVGATGLVGGEAARQAAANPFVDLVCPVRRIPEDAAAGWGMRLVDFLNLDDSDFDWKADAIVIALGTTMRTAGSKEAFEAVDLELVVEVARRAREAGTPSCAVVSSVGADPAAGNFYLSVKGRMEIVLGGLGYRSLAIIRPSLLAGQRRELRPGERFGLLASSLFRPLVPYRYRPVSADAVARSLLANALQKHPGKRVIRSEDLA